MQFDTKIAVVVRTDLEAWQKLNVASFLCGGIAASFPECVGAAYEDASGTKYLSLIGQPILIYGADRPALTSTPDVYARAAADAVEDAIWSAKRDTVTGYGIAVFDVDPGHGSDGQPSIKVTHYHAVGADPVNPASGVKGAPTPDYTEFETFTLVRPR